MKTRAVKIHFRGSEAHSDGPLTVTSLLVVVAGLAFLFHPSVEEKIFKPLWKKEGESSILCCSPPRGSSIVSEC